MKQIAETPGKLSWLCVAFGLYATAVSLPGQTLTTLHTFDGIDGSDPTAWLVQTIDGNFFGTTSSGGANGSGTVFQITPTGALTTLYSFCSLSGCHDGAFPMAGLVRASNGNFYGTTTYGGANNDGTVFEITPSGALSVLYSFGGTDGARPLAGLVQATDGNLYGTTSAGGDKGEGTVYKITLSGALTTLYSFSGNHDGASPWGGLVQAANGNLYGTTTMGGGGESAGTVFKISLSGALTTLYTFCAQLTCPDGSGPSGTLVQATNGNLYGTTGNPDAPNSSNNGTVFQITPSGTLTTLHNFCWPSGCSEAAYLAAGLVLATDGNFYGTTSSTIFRITPSGTLTTLHTFDCQDPCPEGENPYGALMQATDGKLYGTTRWGGADWNGTIFSFSVGLGPFVKTFPRSGKVGATVSIVGTDLTGATRVTFNGTPAKFSVVSTTEIRATVPTGATTGKVRVLTPGGILLSSPFRVL